MTRLRLYVAAALIMTGLSACGRDEVFVTNSPPEIIRFAPPRSEFREVWAGNVMNFTLQARDADQDPLSYYFSLDGEKVYEGSTYPFVLEQPDTVLVTGVVTDGKDETTLEWIVHVLEKDNRPPTIVYFSPTISNPTLVLGDELLFQIKGNDLDPDSLRHGFLVDGVEVSTSQNYRFLAQSVGEYHVVGVVSDGKDAVQWDWRVRVVAFPDTVPPAPVFDLVAVSGANPGEIEIHWTSSGDDGLVGTASEIQVKTAKVEIVTEEDWEIADHKTGEPAPQAGGEVQSMVVTDLNPGQRVFVVVRYLDDFFNLGSIGNSPSVLVRGFHVGGWVRDAENAAPIAGATVKLTAALNETTDENGFYEFHDLPILWGTVDVKDELDTGIIGPYYDLRKPLFVDQNLLLPFFLVRDVPGDWFPWKDYYDYFLHIIGITDLTPGPLKQVRRWERPIDIYPGGFVHNGIDYDEQIASAIAEWESYTQMDLFNVVSSPPAIGIKVRVSDGVQQFKVLTQDEQYQPLTGEIVLDPDWTIPYLPSMRRVLLHELGHALGLYHSTLSRHLMYVGLPLPQDPAPEEIKAVRDLFHIPRGTRSSYYLYE